LPDNLPIVFEVPLRSDLVAAHLAAQKRLNPAIDISPGTEPYIDATVSADTQLMVLAKARQVAYGAVLESAQGNAIAQWGFREGVENGAPSPAIGFVRLQAGQSGVDLFAGDLLVGKTNPALGQFQCREDGHYGNGAFVPIQSVATGYGANLAPGTVLQWVAPRPGSATDAVVVDQNDGVGLTGGHPQPTLDDWKAAIADKLRHPPAADNDAAVRFAARTIPDFAVAYAFSYPAVLGPGVKVITFLCRPAKLGGTRVPSGAQITVMQAHLEYLFGADDGVVVVPIIEQPTVVRIGVTWYPGAGGWVNTPWPDETDDAIITSQSGATAFVVSSVTSPLVGQVIALFDRANLKFVRKTIKTVTGGSGLWSIICATTYGVTDLAYVPVVGQRVSPWSESLNTLPVLLAQYFETLGPGEQIAAASFSLDGLRMRRWPRSPVEWPSIVTDVGLINKLESAPVLDIVTYGTTSPPSIGARGVVSYILTLGDFAVFQKAP